MSLVGIDSIWHRKITKGDFFNIERSSTAGPQGGGGQLFIDIPNSVREGLFKMLDLEEPANGDGDWPPGTVDAMVIGNPTESGTLHFELNRRNDLRYRIRNQNRQSANSERHPAWTAAMGFPEAPNDIQSPDEAKQSLGDGVRIFLVKDSYGGYYAGFTTGAQIPANWPKGVGLEELFDQNSPGGLICLHSIASWPPLIPPVVSRILEAWKRKPNVLLYGPTGTGKTHVISVIWQMLELIDGPPIIMLETEDSDNPFQSQTLDLSLDLPHPVSRDWVTFHQNYGYEDFIIGLRPRPSQPGSGFTLRPRAGRLLDLAINVFSDEFEANSAVLVIDEINRGNTSRIFGEFITFMESEYRDIDDNGRNNPGRLPVPLANVNFEDDLTEEIELPSGGSEKLPVPWFFPRHVYVLASMNSVDRTVAPLDSALARRFERIDMRPDLDVLQSLLDANLTDANRKVEEAGDNIAALTAEECAVLILAQLNFQLATTLGPDFEIGHTYMLPVRKADSEEDGFRLLASVWDQSIMPQLQDRFLTRPEELLRILKVDERTPDGYIFRQRAAPFNREVGDRPTLEPVSLETVADSNIESVQITFRYLASSL